MPRIAGLLERIQQPLYDTLTITPKETYYVFFEEPLTSSKESSVFESSFMDVPKDPEQQCSFCKKPVFGFEIITHGFLNTLHRCMGCDTIYHKSCVKEMSGCDLLGCSQKGKKLSDSQTRIKTLVDTNMTRGSHLPYPQNFEIHAIGLHYDKTVDKYELENFKEYSSFKLFIGTKTYLDLPVSVLDDISNNTDRGGYMFVEPIELIPQQTFRATIRYEGPKKSDATFRIRCVMQGFFRREVC